MNTEMNLAIASFVLGLINYEENLTQSDKQQIMDNSAKIQDEIISRIDKHLQIQDEKIDWIIDKLQEE